jgi:PAS domain S-box-containing protein
MENLPDIISRLDRNLRFLYVSPNVKLLFGISAEHFVGKKPREVGVESHDWSGFEKACRQVFATGKATNREFVRGDRCYRARIVPEFGPAGKTASVLCIDQDVTEQKRIEEELRMLSSRLMDLQDANAGGPEEMHDGTAQNLLRLTWPLAFGCRQRFQTSDYVGRMHVLCEQSREEVRTLSYVLHPPMLDDAGLFPQ